MNLVWITIFLVGEMYASVCGCFDAALAMVSFLFDFFDMCPLQSMKVQEQFHWFMHSVNHQFKIITVEFDSTDYWSGVAYLVCAV